MEQRGQCTEYKSREEIRRQIEVLNQKYRASTGTSADEADEGVHKSREDGSEKIRG